jgi:hypothetical protein
MIASGAEPSATTSLLMVLSATLGLSSSLTEPTALWFGDPEASTALCALLLLAALP